MNSDTSPTLPPVSLHVQQLTACAAGDPGNVFTFQVNSGAQPYLCWCGVQNCLHPPVQWSNEVWPCPDCQRSSSGYCGRHGFQIYPATPFWPLVDPLPGWPVPTAPVPELPVVPAQMGWQCPRCGQCFAPHVDRCADCGPKLVTTSTIKIEPTK